MTLLERLAIAGAALCNLPEEMLNQALAEQSLPPVAHGTYTANRSMASDFRADTDFMRNQLLHPKSFTKLDENR
jgi:hypothetical protein